MSKYNGKSEKVEYDFPQPNKKQTFAEMIYDPKEGTILGRTSKNWGQLFIFYTIFYIILAILFAICMAGLFASLDDKQPTWQLEDSLIGTNPGLGVRPISEQTERGSVIQFNKDKPDEVNYWNGLINTFLHAYNNNTVGGNLKHCDPKQTRDPDDVCLVNLEQFGPCTANNSFGYKDGAPCVFLKLNKIFGWEPKVFNHSTPDMPEDLQNAINNSKDGDLNQVWVSCSGHYGKDKEYFNNIKYYPTQGLPAYYYPYRNQPDYLSPVVAVQFQNLPKSKMIDVECRAWAKNIIYSGSIRDRMGSVNFQMLAD